MRLTRCEIEASQGSSLSSRPSAGLLLYAGASGVRRRQLQGGWACGAPSRLLAVLATVVFLSAAGAARAGQKPRSIDDEDVTIALSSKLWLDYVVDANSMDVDTQDGVVTLTGTVDSLLEKERSVKIAETLVGVRAIVDRLQVKPRDTRSDGEIELDVEAALEDDPATEASELDVAVSGGKVTLTGTVESWQEKELCASVGKGVAGVRAMHNKIVVDYESERPDNEIRQEIAARLANDVLVDDGLIGVSVKDEKVVLTGTVGSLAEKIRARTDAWVGGVESVDASGLTVEWWARDDMRRKSSSGLRTDAEIKRAVKDALLYDPRVISFNPTVEVEGGTVTLSGVVNNLAAREAAEADARNVVGVWRVKNHLKVRPKVDSANAALEKRVARAIKRDPFIDRWDIDVDAYSGSVYLSGDVNDTFDKERVEVVAKRVKGVTDVINALTFHDVWAWKSDHEIREDIRDELFWSPYVDADDVNVTVDDGIATLSGEVDTWGERDAAEENAREGGAQDVDNRLTVRLRYQGPHYGDYLGYRYR